MSSVPAILAFYSLAALTLISGLAVVRTKNVLHAGYWLLPCFVGVAGLFALLEAHFFFVVQLLIYAGAILVLFIFAVMLTRNVMHPRHPQTNALGPWAALIAATLGIGGSWIFVTHPWGSTNTVPAGAAEQTRALGSALIGLYAVPFEVSSLLLLAALIGAIVLAKSEREDLPETPPLALTDEVDVVVEEPGPREVVGVRR